MKPKYVIACILLFGLLSEQSFSQSISYSITVNTSCSSVPECDCHGDFHSLVLLYRGQSGIDISVYRKYPFYSYNRITTLQNVQDGQILPVTGQFLTHTFFTSANFDDPVTMKTTCSQLHLGDEIGPFIVAGYTDGNGISCNMPLCNGSIDLTVTGNGPYTYRWSNGSTSQDVDHLCTGTYTVYVKGRHGSSQQRTIYVGQDCPCDHVNCSDSNPCTIDHCADGVCSNTPIACSDNNPCTTDQCVHGQCIFIPVNCSDNDLCTYDRCYSGECRHTSRVCNDWNPCTDDVCNNGYCVFTPNNCNDNNPCTVDFCNRHVGNFFWHDDDDNDNDNDHDNHDDDNNGWRFGWPQCVHQPVVCNDENDCTTDECTGSDCIFTPVPDCGNDLCAGITCNDNSACTSDACDNGQCVFTAIVCDDGNACTNDACADGQCAFMPINCNDADDCTHDACRDGQCEHVPQSCDDNDGCTTDACDSGQCVFTNVSCDDANACTNDACDNGQCIYSAINCADADACTMDGCDNGNCTHVAIPGCGVPSCVNVICNDFNSCTVDFCQNGQCQYVQISCDDNNSCTSDGCQGGQCVFTAIVCNDNDVCTADECVGGQCSFAAIPGCGGDPCAGSTLAASISGTAPNPCNACNGSATASASGGVAPFTYSWSTGETTLTLGGNSATTKKCINAGDGQFIASTGDTFLTDFYYNGTTFTYINNTVADIANTTDDVLFRTERNSTGSFTYDFPVTNGQYDVSLYFAEIYYGVNGGTMSNPPFTGKRIFDVSIEGTLVLDDYDIYADAGPATATIKTFTTTVSDGALNILFTSVTNRAKVSAIRLKPHLAGGLCSGSYTVTVTDASGCSATASTQLCSDPCANIICDDEDLCTSDACVNGNCPFTPINCNDNDACTADACDNILGCTYAPGLAVQIAGTNPSPTCTDCNGSVAAIIQGGAAPYAYSWSTGAITPSLGVSAATHKCINAGNGQFIASTGDTFVTDYFYNGTTFTYVNNTVSDIANTTDDVLFRTERNSTGSFTYDIPATNGQYDVSLYFAEIYFGVTGGTMSNPPFTGKRVFDVAIEGMQVLNDYDIYADVGPATATIKTFTTTVSDGALNILFTSVTNRAKVSAICVKPSANQPGNLCAGSYSVTVTDANHCTAEASLNLCGGGAAKLSGEPGNENQFASEISNLRVYPVPFNNKLTIEFESLIEGKAELRMIDVLGQMVKSESLYFSLGENKKVINLDGTMAGGMYFMELRSGEKTQYVKLYKEK